VLINDRIERVAQDTVLVDQAGITMTAVSDYADLTTKCCSDRTKCPAIFDGQDFLPSDTTLDGCDPEIYRSESVKDPCRNGKIH
jgi:hypothetical protein